MILVFLSYLFFPFTLFSADKIIHRNKIFSLENKYQPYFELGGIKYFNQYTKGAGVYDLFLPLIQKENRLIFTDLRIFDRTGSSSEGNAHLGYRQLFSETKQMFGIYGSFDRKRSDHKKYFNQIMLGGEYWQDKWFFGGNIYKPVGRTKKFIDKKESASQIISHIAPIKSTINYYEKAQGGIDAELGHTFTESLTGYLGGYYFSADDTKTVSGPKIRLTYDYRPTSGKRLFNVLDGVSLEAGIQHDKPRGTSGYIGIKLKVGLTNSEKSSNISGFERHMVELVRRDPDIIVGVIEKKDQVNEKCLYQGKAEEEKFDKDFDDNIKARYEDIEEEWVKKKQEKERMSKASIEKLGDSSLNRDKNIFRSLWDTVKTHPYMTTMGTVLTGGVVLTVYYGVQYYRHVVDTLTRNPNMSFASLRPRYWNYPNFRGHWV